MAGCGSSDGGRSAARLHINSIYLSRAASDTPRTASTEQANAIPQCMYTGATTATAVSVGTNCNVQQHITRWKLSVAV